MADLSKNGFFDDHAFCRLASLYLENQLSADEIVGFNEALRTSEQKRTAFMWLCVAHAAAVKEARELGEVGAESEAELSNRNASTDLNDVIILPAIREVAATHDLPDETKNDFEQPIRPTKRIFKPWRRVASVLLALAGLGLIWTLIIGRSSHCVVELSLDAKWAAAEDIDLQAGSPIGSGTHTLIAGTIRLGLPNQTSVVLQAPVKFEIISATELNLAQGKICARVGSGAAKLSITTPDMRATDLGTEFAIEVVVGKATHLEVLEGRVRADVSSPSAGPISQTLNENQAILVNAGSGQFSHDLPRPLDFVRPSEIEAIATNRPAPNPVATKSEPMNLAAINIGSDSLKGECSSDGSIWKVSGSGVDIFNESDQCNFACKAINGNCTLEAQLLQVASFVDRSMPSFAKSGLMFRTSNDADSAFVDLHMTNGVGIQMICRESTGATAKVIAAVPGQFTPLWFKLTRTADVDTGYYSNDGVHWTLVGNCTTSLPPSTQIGLVVSSSSKSKLATTIFSNVTIFHPSP